MTPDDLTVMNNCNSTATQIRDHLTDIRLIWCPGHIGDYLNEVAHRQAHLAANN